jgi:hypothetical protein
VLSEPTSHDGMPTRTRHEALELPALVTLYLELDEALRLSSSGEGMLRGSRDACAAAVLERLAPTLRWAARSTARHPAEVEDLLREARVHALASLKT